jgi:hypothetical protein
VPTPTDDRRDLLTVLLDERGLTIARLRRIA